MRNISFAMTTEQIKSREKTVTRRLGWKNLKPGQLLQAVVKGQGLKKGEHPEKLCVIRVVSVRFEVLKTLRYYPDDAEEECAREGFPDATATDFIEMFCLHNNCSELAIVTRIEFAYE